MNGFEVRTTSKVVIAALVLFSLAICAATSQAGTINANNVPTITVDDEGFEGPAWSYSPAAETLMNLPDRGKKVGVETALMHIQGGRADVQIKQLEFDPDPFVLNNILITNTTGSTQTYSVGIAMPTSFPGPNFISGTVRTSVIDGGGPPGATVATVPGFPIYTAEKDFVGVATLQNHPFSVVAPPALTNSSAATFGPLVHAAPVVSNIGIQLRFTLTAEDTASILSRFDVVAIPEPASFGLSIFGLFVAGGFRRRRTR
jgi:hypothetical protein